MNNQKINLLQKSFLYVLLVLTVIPSVAQDNNKESLEIFDQIIGLENTKLYNGKRYYNLYKSTLGNHNFFAQPNYQKGHVYYDGQNFTNIDLKYDVFNDKLIYKPNGEKSFLNIELIENKVDSFSFHQNKFINASLIKGHTGMVSGLVEVIYNVPLIKLYAKRKKTVAERIKQNQLTYTFYEADSYYLSYNNSLYEIDSSKDLRKLFPKLNKAIKKQAKENKKRFHDDTEGLYLHLINYINFELNTNNAN